MQKQQRQQCSDENDSFGEEETSRINENDKNERNDNVESGKNQYFIYLKHELLENKMF